MQFLTDLLTLRFFVTPYLMVLAYWAGAILLPLMLATIVFAIWYKLNRHETAAAGIREAQRFVDSIPYSRPLRIAMVGTGVAVFLFLELLWRILFEFLIALFHIHDALLQMASKT